EQRMGHELERDERVTGRPAADARPALPLQAHDLARLGAGRRGQLDRLAGRQVDPHLFPAGKLLQRHGDLAGDILAPHRAQAGRGAAAAREAAEDLAQYVVAAEFGGAAARPAEGAPPARTLALAGAA